MYPTVVTIMLYNAYLLYPYAMHKLLIINAPVVENSGANVNRRIGSRSTLSCIKK